MRSAGWDHGATREYGANTCVCWFTNDTSQTFAQTVTLLWKNCLKYVSMFDQ